MSRLLLSVQKQREAQSSFMSKVVGARKNEGIKGWLFGRQLLSFTITEPSTSLDLHVYHDDLELSTLLCMIIAGFRRRVVPRVEPL